MSFSQYIPPEANKIVPHDRIYVRDNISLSFSLSEALALAAVLKKAPGDWKLKVDTIKQHFTPLYAYKIKCSDCNRTYEIKLEDPLTTEELNKGHIICIGCSDDYK